VFDCGFECSLAKQEVGADKVNICSSWRFCAEIDSLCWVDGAGTLLPEQLIMDNCPRLVFNASRE
jgi:hypothetical protein